MQAARTASCLISRIWSNKHVGIEVKSKTYKAATRPILTYSIETSKTKQILKTTEMRGVRKIADRILMNRKNGNDNRRMYSL